MNYVFHRDLFHALENLQELHLDYNELQSIDGNAFSKTTKIHTIHLEHNELDFTSSLVLAPKSNVTPFPKLTHLRYLYLANNSMRHFFGDWNAHNSQLEVLDLSMNRIKLVNLSLITSIWNQPITVNLTGNQIKYIESDRTDLAIAETIFPTDASQITGPNIRWNWHLNNNPLDCGCEMLYFRKFIDANKVTTLNLAMDNMRCQTPANLQNHLVAKLDVNDLECTLDSQTHERHCPDQCKCWVQANTLAVRIDCSNAGLTEVPALPDLKTATPRWNFSHIELNIENNRITALPNLTANGYNLITQIRARNNSLGTLVAKDLSTNLTHLDISHNKMETLNVDVLKQLSLSGNLQLSLEGNQWICECKSDFMLFVRTHLKQIDYTSIRCNDGEFIQDKSDECPRDKTIMLLVCILVALFGLFLGTVFALYYKYQQEVKVWLFARGYCLWFVTEEELDKDKKYDAFISFSHKDEDFINNHLVPELENGPNPFKVCVHFRDWVVGEYIPTQVNSIFHISYFR